ncbi:uncharacterized protein METZ01_LOCUS410910, partial [marine metagenome]
MAPRKVGAHAVVAHPGQALGLGVKHQRLAKRLAKRVHRAVAKLDAGRRVLPLAKVDDRVVQPASGAYSRHRAVTQAVKLVQA